MQHANGKQCFTKDDEKPFHPAVVVPLPSPVPGGIMEAALVAGGVNLA